MGNPALKSVMLASSFDKLSLPDQIEKMRGAGATDEMLSDWVGMNAKGPMLSATDVRVERGEGAASSAADAARILEQYHEPNRLQDIGPKLVEFGLLGATAEAPGAIGAATKALRGLSAASKAKKVAKVAGYAGAGVAADQTLRSLGVPPWLSEAVLAAGGMTTKPGRAMLRAGIEALSGETAAAKAVPAAVRTVDEAKAATIAAARAAREAQAAETVARARAVEPAERLGGVYGPYVRTGRSTEARLADQATAAAADVATAETAAASPTKQAAVDALAARAQSAARSVPNQRAAAQASQWGFGSRPAVARPSAAPTEAANKAAEISQKIVQWKTQNKWSGAQMESALRNVYGVPIKDGREMIRLVLSSAGIQ